MKPSKKINVLWRNIRIGRRISQLFFLFLFFSLIFATAALTGGGFDEKNSATVPYPVEAFLNIDPLAGLVVFLSTWSVPATLLWSLIVVGFTVFFGRFFCGWVCPMGTLNHAVSEFRPSLTASKKIARNQPGSTRKIKYLLLITLLVTAFFGSAAAGLFDPLSIVTRGVALTILPIINYVGNTFLDNASHTGSATVLQVADKMYDLGAGVLFHHGGLITQGGIGLSLFFAAILLANRFVPRLWCRYFCPLGALLGLLGRFGLFTLKKDESKCTHCGKCEQFCSGAASPLPGTEWERAECDMCMNCVAVCEYDALSFGLSGHKEKVAESPDLSRRQVLSSVATGALIVPVLRTGTLTGPGNRPDPACIRPPGAIDEDDFLARCIRCGQCMKICPNNALHPALDEAGPEGLWTPVLVPKVGYCEPSCTLCSQVCPTAALRIVTEDQKTGANGAGLVRIGTAFIDRGRCLPWAMDTPCTVCEEFCPVSPKAIRLEKVEQVFTHGDGATKVELLRPFINPDLCSGCGACENVCPVHDKAAVRVSSAGETRSSSNKLLL